MRQLKMISLRITALTAGCLLLNACGLVGIIYVRVVENDPFQNAADVSRITDDQIEFADGRVLRSFGGVDPILLDEIHRSADRVGLEIGESGQAILFVRKRETNCELGRPLFVLPLIPVNRPAYGRKAVAFGKIEND